MLPYKKAVTESCINRFPGTYGFSRPACFATILRSGLIAAPPYSHYVHFDVAKRHILGHPSSAFVPRHEIILNPHLISQKLITFLEELQCNATGLPSIILPSSEKSAIITAHSMGGLIARHAVNQRGWSSLRRRSSVLYQHL